MGNTNVKVKRAWFTAQRAQCEHLRADDVRRKEWNAFLIDEKNCALLGPWFDKLIQHQRANALKAEAPNG